MDIWLFSLVLVSVIAGWGLGRWRPFARTNSEQKEERYSESYSKGLNYLLLDDSENAIKVFSELIELNRDTVQIHITLGNLYRAKGEVDRAIRIHQNLLARPDLARQQRIIAVEELASDYLKAGLLDRAEKLYQEMIQLKADDLTPYRHLLNLHMTGKSWLDATTCAKVLYAGGETGAAVVLSQCYCEVADEAISLGNTRVARDNLSNALDVDRSCVRAALLLIELDLGSGKIATAKKIFQRLVKENPEYMELYIEPAKLIFLHGNQSGDYRNFLQQQYEKHHSTRLAIALIEYYVSTDQKDVAKQFLTEVLSHSPSFELYTFSLRFLRSDSASLQAILGGLADFLKLMQNKKAEFLCSSCGYTSHAIQWNCPSCRNWASMKPIQDQP